MMSLFVPFWILSASYTVESRPGQHFICDALDNRDHQQPSLFPLLYACHGDDEDTICKLREIDSSGRNDSKDEPGAVTWWVYEGQREQASRSTGDLSGDEWVDCAGYFAHTSSDLGPSERVEDYSRPTYEVASKYLAGGRSQEPRTSTGIEPTGTLPLSQRLRSPREHDDRGSVGGHITSSASSPMGRGGNKLVDPDQQKSNLVYAPNASCDDMWLSWPAMQERAMARGTFIVFDAISSVGNLFIIINAVMKFVQILDLGLIIRWSDVPGFRAAFNPGVINWDVDPAQFMQPMVYTEGTNTTGLHSLEFDSYQMVLSDSQLEVLAAALDINEIKPAALADHFRENLSGRINVFMRQMRERLGLNTAFKTQPCAWNMLLRRSPSMIASLEEYSPWGVTSDAAGPRHQTAEYVAWHIRTADGETARSYTPARHKYVIQEPSSDVCPTFLTASKDALQLTKACRASTSVLAGDELVYISSNSKSMAKNCTVEAAQHDIVIGHVDLGLSTSDAHTKHSQHPLQTALGALLDFFFLLDAKVIVRTGSSFSGTVCLIKGLACHNMKYNTLPERRLSLCLPSDC